MLLNNIFNSVLLFDHIITIKAQYTQNTLIFFMTRVLIWHTGYRTPSRVRSCISSCTHRFIVSGHISFQALSSQRQEVGSEEASIYSRDPPPYLQIHIVVRCHLWFQIRFIVFRFFSLFPSHELFIKSLCWDYFVCRQTRLARPVRLLPPIGQ
jgi:hypothetical protein